MTPRSASRAQCLWSPFLIPPPDTLHAGYCAWLRGQHVTEDDWIEVVW